MSWGKYNHAGVEYDLSHLSPFTVAVTPKSEGAPTYKVLVSFGHHTFSRDWADGDPRELQVVVGREAPRCVCPARVDLSKNLPGIVAGSSSGRAYFSEGRNFLFVENLAGLNGPYAVFFNMERGRSKGIDATMFVVSAYEKPALPQRLPAITFATLVSKTVAGQRVTRPKK